MFMQRRSQLDKSEKWAYFVFPPFSRGTLRSMFTVLSVSDDYSRSYISRGSAAVLSSTLTTLIENIICKLPPDF